MSGGPEITHIRQLPSFANIVEQPPVNYDAEKALLGALLANNLVFFKVNEFLRPEHFADALHGRIYFLIAGLVNKGEVANPVTLLNIIAQDGGGDGYPGGAPRYLTDLALNVVTVLNADDYGRVVLDLWRRRRVMELCRIIDEDARTFSPDREAVQILEDAEEMLARLSADTASRRATVSMGEASLETVQRIEAAMQRGYGGLSTGLVNVNKITTGLHKTDLIILAGATSMGKTTLGLNIADNVAALIRSGIAAEQLTEGEVLFASLEMSRDQLVEKFYATRTDISTHRMRTGGLDAESFERIMEAHQGLQDLPFMIDDTPGQTPAYVRSIAKRMQRGRRGLSLVVVDYLQLMETEGGTFRDNRVAQVSQISRQLKKIAKELQVPVIALSQLSRKLEEREDKRPILADLRESGSIEQDADIVLFAYREEYYLRRMEPRQRDSEHDDKFQDRHSKWERRMEEVANTAELICSKNRHGPLKTARLHFNGASSRFTDLYEDEAP